MSYWINKVALITGGSSGLGWSLATAYVGAGARVVLIGRDAVKLQAAQARLSTSAANVLSLTADVTKPSDVERMIATTLSHFGQLDVLVNNVGVSMRGEVLNTPPGEFQRLFEVNFLSMVRCIQAAAPALIASRGHIVNIGSLAAKCAARYLGAYPASKFPVAALSQQLRLEIGPQGVHTLLVCPGPLRRDDAGARYAKQAAQLPAAAKQPGGGVKLKGIEPAWLSQQILRACERRQAELIVPGKAKWLFAISQLWPSFGDWLILRATSSE
jgi:short-subunit dehydrogenase